MKKLLRLWVMTKITHSEEYVIGALKSNGVDIENVSHDQIAAYKSVLKSNEADLMIELAFGNEKTHLKNIDTTIFKPAT